MGGKVIHCNNCGHEHFIYYSCGHSHCPICQSIKREQWIDKLKKELYRVPYVHSVFTLPHQLKGLARNNPKKIYSLLMRSAWKTVKSLAADENNIGAVPGMIAVLHTFGSDMKYHIHVHCLITFGGIDDNKRWVYPKRKDKIAPYRQMCTTFKDVFLEDLEKLYDQSEIEYHLNYNQVKSMVKNIRWVVFNTKPTVDTSVLENYLARYINRIAISNSRVEYIKQHTRAILLYNNYRQQQKGRPAPKAYKNLHPLEVIHQILQHVLPAYFQKCRRYGIQSSPTKKKIGHLINPGLVNNNYTIRTVFQIIKHLLGVEAFTCPQCESTDLSISYFPADKEWITAYFQIATPRPPPSLYRHIISTS